MFYAHGMIQTRSQPEDEAHDNKRRNKSYLTIKTQPDFASKALT